MVKYKCEKCGTVSVEPKNVVLTHQVVLQCSKCQNSLTNRHLVVKLIPEPIRTCIVVVVDKESGNIGYLHSDHHYGATLIQFPNPEHAKQMAEKFFVTMCNRGFLKNRFDLRVVELENPATD